MPIVSSTDLKGKSHEWVLEGTTTEAVQEKLTQIFAESKYKVKSTDWKGIVFERGNRWLHFIGGALVKYHKMTATVSNSGENVTVTLSNNSSGFSGGVIGIMQVNKEWKRLLAILDEQLGSQVY